MELIVFIIIALSFCQAVSQGTKTSRYKRNYRKANLRQLCGGYNGHRNVQKGYQQWNDMDRSQQEQMEFMNRMQQQQFDEMNRWAMEESMKSVTPFEMGGYDMTQGNSFNNF